MQNASKNIQNKTDKKHAETIQKHSKPCKKTSKTHQGHWSWHISKSPEPLEGHPYLHPQWFQA